MLAFKVFTEGGAEEVNLTNAVNGNAGSEPLLDVSDHTVGHLAIVGAVQVVIVDVQDSIRIRLAGSLESNSDKVLTEDPGEDGVSERAVLVEDLVDDILSSGVLVASSKGNEKVNLPRRGSGPCSGSQWW